MSRYIPDYTSKKWVILTSHRTERPDDNHSKSDIDIDPFAEGNEQLTPKEIMRIGSGDPDTKGWDVRVIPNKYPISDFHEVIIHAPTEGEIHSLPSEHALKVFHAYQERYNYYCQMGQVIIFCNQGEEGGASLTHPHSQLVVLPHQIKISTLAREPLANIISENEHATAYCPEYSEWPYEIWIAPKKEESTFGKATDDELQAVIELYQKEMKKLEALFKEKYPEKPFSYNFYISPQESWYLRIIPRMTHIAGFELCTGLSVNVTDPEDVARKLRDENEKLAVPAGSQEMRNEELEISNNPKPNAKAKNVEKVVPVKTDEEKVDDLMSKLSAWGGGE